MKSWTLAELQNVVAALKPLLGLRLQEVQTSPQDVVLGFYHPDGVLWLWLDLDTLSPSLLPWPALPFKPQVAKTPLQLFLRAHFRDRVLGEVHLPPGLGRVVHLDFGPEHRLEVRLFPHVRNLLAFADGKRIAWQKPQELHAENLTAPTSLRDLDELREQWLRGRGGPRTKKTKLADPAQRLETELAKKRKAVDKVRDELARKREQPWREIGEWLKMHQTLQVPTEWELYIDKRRKLAWNIEQCFQKSREVEGKLAGTERRLQILNSEIETLEARRAAEQFESGVAPLRAQPNLASIEAQGRTLNLTPELRMVAGRSAEDNMRILRKARAWDLWFHLRDFPSAHAVLFRNKNAQVNDALLHQAAQWFIRMHLAAKAKGSEGEKFTVLMTECRYVRAIKGDKIGRVTYQNERVLIVGFKMPAP